MAYFAKLTLAEFKDLVENELDEEFGKTDYIMAVKAMIPLARKIVKKLPGAETSENIWSLWTSSITTFGDLSPRMIEKVSNFHEGTVTEISRLESRVDVIHPIAFHYRAHILHAEGDREIADYIDKEVFGSPLRQRGIVVFTYEPERYVFPKPSAPFFYPPYKTRRNVERLLQERPDHGVWLDPHNHHSIPLEGREGEQQRLTSFMNKPGPFRICPVIGPSGAGKTRLISEWMKSYVPIHGGISQWDAGVLTTEISNAGRPHARDPQPWNSWTIERNTLIVIDYTYAFDEVARAIFEKAVTQSRFAVRLILVDHVMPRLLEQDFLWRSIGGGRASRIDQIEAEYLDPAIYLSCAEDNSKLMRHVIAAAASIGRTGGGRYDIDDPVVLRAAAHLEHLGADERQRGAVRHPLFAALLGQVIRERDGEVIDFSAWHRRDLLSYYFDAPDRLPWAGWNVPAKTEDERLANSRKREDGQIIGALVSAATLRRGLPIADVAALIDRRPAELDDLVQRAGRIVSSDAEHRITPFLPDILGETFVLSFLEEAAADAALFQLHAAMLGQEGLQDADEIADNYRETVFRTVRNLANDDQSRRDVRRAWDALISILDPNLAKYKAPLRLAMSCAIAETMEAITKLILHVQEKNIDDALYFQKFTLPVVQNLEKKIELIEARFSLDDICVAAEMGDAAIAAETFFLFFENSASPPLRYVPELRAIAAAFASRNEMHLPALALASVQGQVRCVKAILDHTNEKVTDTAAGGETSMMLASAFGQLEVVKFLHNTQPDLITKTAKNGWTVAMFACKHDRVLKFLYDACPNIFTKTAIQGITIAMVVCSKGYLSALKFLHDACPEVITKTGQGGVSAAMFACDGGHLPLLEFLHREYPDLISTTTDEGRTIAIVACMQGDLPALKLLYDARPDLITKTEKDGMTAAMSACLYGHLSILKFLHGAFPDLITKTKKEGETAAMMAVMHGHLPVLEFMQGACPDLLTKPANNGWTAAMTACVHGHLHVLKFLHGACPDLITKPANDGWTAAMVACLQGHLPMLEFLHGAYPDLIPETAKDGTTAAMAACIKGHPLVLEFLHRNCPDLITKTLDNGWTAAMSASAHGHLEVVKLLIGLGLDPNARTSNGHTALSLAEANGHQEVVEFLRSGLSE